MCSPGPPRAVIFDLDGTLVQTREASWKVFEKVSETHGLGIDTADKFYELFADNFYVSLRALCGGADKAEKVEADFMSRLRSDYEPKIIPGMADVVKTLVPRATLAVLSSNSTEVVRRILSSHSLAYCFAHVFGGDVAPDKTEGIARFLADAAQGSGRLCQAYYDEAAEVESVSAGSTVIITDTVGDVEAAVRSGIRPIGVAWGMHTEEQLLAAGAEFVAIWPQEILSHLLSGVPLEPSGSCGCSTTPTGSAAETELVAAADVRRSRRRAASTAPTPGPAPAPQPAPRVPARNRRPAEDRTRADLAAAMKLLMA